MTAESLELSPTPDSPSSDSPAPDRLSLGALTLMVLPSLVILALGISLVHDTSPIASSDAEFASPASVQIIERSPSDRAASNAPVATGANLAKVAGETETRSAASTPTTSTPPKASDVAWLKLAVQMITAERDDALAQVRTLRDEVARFRATQSQPPAVSDPVPPVKDTSTTIIGSPHRR